MWKWWKIFVAFLGAQVALNTAFQNRKESENSLVSFVPNHWLASTPPMSRINARPKKISKYNIQESSKLIKKLSLWDKESAKYVQESLEIINENMNSGSALILARAKTLEYAKQGNLNQAILWLYTLWENDKNNQDVIGSLVEYFNLLMNKYPDNKNYVNLYNNFKNQLENKDTSEEYQKPLKEPLSDEANELLDTLLADYFIATKPKSKLNTNSLSYKNSSQSAQIVAREKINQIIIQLKLIPENQRNDLLEKKVSEYSISYNEEGFYWALAGLALDPESEYLLTHLANSYVMSYALRVHKGDDGYFNSYKTKYFYLLEKLNHLEKQEHFKFPLSSIVASFGENEKYPELHTLRYEFKNYQSIDKWRNFTDAGEIEKSYLFGLIGLSYKAPLEDNKWIAWEAHLITTRDKTQSEKELEENLSFLIEICVQLYQKKDFDPRTFLNKYGIKFDYSTHLNYFGYQLEAIAQHRGLQTSQGKSALEKYRTAKANLPTVIEEDSLSLILESESKIASTQTIIKEIKNIESPPVTYEGIDWLFWGGWATAALSLVAGFFYTRPKPSLSQNKTLEKAAEIYNALVTQNTQLRIFTSDGIKLNQKNITINLKELALALDENKKNDFINRLKNKIKLKWPSSAINKNTLTITISSTDNASDYDLAFIVAFYNDYLAEENRLLSEKQQQEIQAKAKEEEKSKVKEETETLEKAKLKDKILLDIEILLEDTRFVKLFTHYPINNPQNLTEKLNYYIDKVNTFIIDYPQENDFSTKIKNNLTTINEKLDSNSSSEKISAAILNIRNILDKNYHKVKKEVSKEKTKKTIIQTSPESITTPTPNKRKKIVAPPPALRIATEPSEKIEIISPPPSPEKHPGKTTQQFLDEAKKHQTQIAENLKSPDINKYFLFFHLFQFTHWSMCALEKKEMSKSEVALKPIKLLRHFLKHAPGTMDVNGIANLAACTQHVNLSSTNTLSVQLVKLYQEANATLPDRVKLYLSKDIYSLRECLEKTSRLLTGDFSSIWVSENKKENISHALLGAIIELGEYLQIIKKYLESSWHMLNDSNAYTSMLCFSNVTSHLNNCINIHNHITHLDNEEIANLSHEEKESLFYLVNLPDFNIKKIVSMHIENCYEQIKFLLDQIKNLSPNTKPEFFGSGSYIEQMGNLIKDIGKYAARIEIETNENLDTCLQTCISYYKHNHHFTLNEKDAMIELSKALGRLSVLNTPNEGLKFITFAQPANS